jgi:hypothetical protein
LGFSTRKAGEILGTPDAGLEKRIFARGDVDAQRKRIHPDHLPARSHEPRDIVTESPCATTDVERAFTGPRRERLDQNLAVLELPGAHPLVGTGELFGVEREADVPHTGWDSCC